MDKQKIAGVVLAGGCSSRMGENKAWLNYQGQSLLDHMIGILQQTGLNDIYVSGDIKGYRCIPDQQQHKGPAWAMHDVLQQLDDVDGALFLPVDMPLLTADMLRLLIGQANGGYFMNSPLPAFITKPYPQKRVNSVKALLAATHADPVTLPVAFQACMANTNTPQEWLEILQR